ncbi:hypothetical protein [Nocardia panacis]|uniref:hypothetical protein n=1 Tax=Nocardia panacis TaxID=2340916 RepID=UPI0019394356|nr:hypothetical protein [Nocardia panacis]
MNRHYRRAALVSRPSMARWNIWNGLDDNNDRAATVITAFLDDEPAPLPNYPTAKDIPTFLSRHE